MDIALLLLVVSVLLWLNIRATLAVVRDTLSELRQQVWQLLLVWLLPLIGSLVVLAVHRPDEQPSRRYREPPEVGDDFGVSTRGLRGNRSDAEDD